MNDWIQPAANQLLQGFLVTLQLAGLAVPAGVALGLVVGLTASIPFKPVQWATAIYIEVWRGLPIVVTLFFMFFGLPALGLTLSSLMAAAIGLTLWGSANIAALVRGAIATIPRSQHEAGAALGMNWLRRMRFVILPQTIRRIIPPTLGILTIVLQATTTGALIGVEEVLFEGRITIERLTLTVGQTHAVPILGTVLILFFIASYGIARLANALERKLQV